MKKKTKISEPCWCPCQCSCQEPDFVLNPSGLCPDCEEGNHEVPPEGVQRGVEELLKLHKSIVCHYEKIIALRKLPESPSGR